MYLNLYSMLIHFFKSQDTYNVYLYNTEIIFIFQRATQVPFHYFLNIWILKFRMTFLVLFSLHGFQILYEQTTYNQYEMVRLSDNVLFKKPYTIWWKKFNHIDRKREAIWP